MTTKTFIIVIIFTFTACNISQRQENPKQETPKALEGDEIRGIEISSKRGFDDLVEGLYRELLDKDPQLKNIENKIQELNKGKNDSTELFYKYDSKNQSYYRTANGYINQLNDSVLKTKIRTLITNSMTQYNSSVAKQNTLLKVIEDRNITITDLHTVLKITSTLPVIEKYQADNLSSSKPIENFIQKQNEVIKLADTLLKKQLSN